MDNKPNPPDAQGRKPEHQEQCLDHLTSATGRPPDHTHQSGQPEHLAQQTEESAARCLPLDPSTFSVLSQVMKQQEVFQLHIEKQQEITDVLNVDDKTMDLTDANTQVILVYQDILTCGACSKQFVELHDFLQHKTQHTIGGTGLLKCELCKVVYMNEEILVAHYKEHHNLELAETLTDAEQQAQDGNCLIEMRPPEENGEIITLEAKGEINKLNGEMDRLDENYAEDGTEERQKTQAESKVQERCEIIADIGTNKNEYEGQGLVEVQADHVANMIKNSESEKTKEESVEGLKDKLGNDVLQKGAVMPSRSPSRRIKARRQVRSQWGSRHNVANTCGRGGTENGEVSAAPVDDITQQTSTMENGQNSPKNGQNGVSDSFTDFSFVLITEMVKGNAFTYGKTWFKCLHCEYKTTGKLNISKHMNERHRDMLELHESIEVKDIVQNDKKKVMRMSVYNKMFGRESRLRRQGRRGRKLEKQDMPGIFPCERCDKVFHRLRYLRKHSLTHRSEKKFICEECGKSFKSKTYLTVHRRTHNEKLFKCNQCDFTSKVNAAIHAHRQFHSQGSVLCDTCGFAYTDKSTLNKHKRVHDLSRPHACNFPGCTWRFKTEVMCKAHLRAHTTEGKFKCSYCGYVFRHKHHLQRHETNTHGIKQAKTRSHSPRHQTELMDPEFYETQGQVNCVVIGPDGSEQLQTGGLSTQHLVVATDTNGTPITFEGSDISALNVAYQSLLSTQEGEHHDTQTILLTQPEGQIVFQQE